MKRWIVLIFNTKKAGWNVRQPKQVYTFRESTPDKVGGKTSALMKAKKNFRNDYFFINEDDYVFMVFSVNEPADTFQYKMAEID